jgi:septal ring factor EnvC (AmiA/AmiB activator)
MSGDYKCECKHRQTLHRGRTYWCLVDDCTCKRYTPDFAAAETADRPLTPGRFGVVSRLDPSAETADIVARAQAQPDQPALSAQLARVEQERDQLREALASARDDRDFFKEGIAAAHADVESIARTADLVRAELATARAEVEQLRAQLADRQGEAT